MSKADAGTLFAVAIATMTERPKVMSEPVAPVRKRRGERNEGIALIIGVRLLQTLIIFFLWLVMR